MPRPSRPWFRIYTEMFADRKLRRMKPEHRWLFVACLGAARESSESGVLMLSNGDPMTVEDIADYAGMDVRATRFGLRSLVTQGLLSEDSENTHGVFAFRSPTFQHRQYESDDVTKRTRKHRQSKESGDVGTFQPRSEERSREREGNAPERAPAPATETETETETEKPSCSPTGVGRTSEAIDDDFAEWYAAYPRKQGRGQALKAYRTARKKVDHQTLVDAVGDQSGALMAKGRQYCPLPATWLNGERWADEAESPTSEPPPIVNIGSPPDHLSSSEQVEWIHRRVAEERAKAGRA